MGAPGTTPGPWSVSKRGARRVTNHHGLVICNAVLRNQGGPKAKSHMKDEHEAEANALQIAASGALYDATNSAWAVLSILIDAGIIPEEHRAPVEQCRDNARNALALARGEAQS